MAHQPMAERASAASVRAKQAQAVQTEDTMTPKGTLTILFLYAGLIVVLWGYMYFSMLARR